MRETFNIQEPYKLSIKAWDDLLDVWEYKMILRSGQGVADAQLKRINKLNRQRGIRA